MLPHFRKLRSSAAGENDRPSIAMLSILQTRYQRVEKALDTLLDSITAYNPSITAAEELVAADDAISEGLEERE